MAKTITISGVLTDLEAGVTRTEMATKYGITPREVKALFEHPKLKGKKAKKVFKPSFEIVDDVPDAPLPLGNDASQTIEPETVPEEQDKNWE